MESHKHHSLKRDNGIHHWLRHMNFPEEYKHPIYMMRYYKIKILRVLLRDCYRVISKQDTFKNSRLY